MSIDALLDEYSTLCCKQQIFKIYTLTLIFYYKKSGVHLSKNEIQTILQKYQICSSENSKFAGIDCSETPHTIIPQFNIRPCIWKKIDHNLQRRSD